MRKKTRCNKLGQKTQADYMCGKCSTKFTVRRRGDSDTWMVPLSVEHQVSSIHSVCTIISIFSVCAIISIHSVCTIISIFSVCTIISIHSVCTIISIFSVCTIISILMCSQEGCECKKIIETKQADVEKEDVKHTGKKTITVLKHEDFSRVPGLLAFIELNGASSAFRNDQMASAIMKLYNTVVDKQLLYRTAKRAHDLMFGKTQSDVIALEEIRHMIEQDGGKLVWVTGADIGKTDSETAEKYFGLIWIAPYCHILVDHYGDMYCSDGTHGISVNNWRAIPLCVLNSLKNPHPVSMAFCTSENTAVLAIMARLVHEKCKEHNVMSPFGEDVDSESWKRHTKPLDADLLHEKFVCVPEWRAFVHSLLDRQPRFELIPNLQLIRPTYMTDGGGAFAAFANQFTLWHVLCKMHLSALNTVGSSNR
jgi:hypothetical protein